VALDRASRLAARFSFSATPRITFRDARRVRCFVAFLALFGFHFHTRGYTPDLRLLPIAARTRNQSVGPILRAILEIEGRIRQLRRGSSNHPIRSVVISQVKGGLISCVPCPPARTILRRHLF